jgi:hypothetical protein
MSTSASFNDAIASAVASGHERLLTGVALGAARAFRKGMVWFCMFAFAKTHARAVEFSVRLTAAR